MIIFNEKELNSPYVKENKIIDINSTEKDFFTLIKKVEAGEDISEIANITITRFTPYADFQGELKFEPILPGTPEGDRVGRSYSTIYTQEEFDQLNNENSFYKRPQAFIEYEKDMFEMPTNFVFNHEITEISNEELLHEMYSAAGILPTLWGEKDLTVEEKKKMSTDGAKLIRIFENQETGQISKDNGIPSRKRIEFYESLNDYEKRIINNGRIHPMYLIDLAIKLRHEPTEKDPMKMSNFLLTTQMMKEVLRIADYNSAVTDEIQRESDEERKKELQGRYQKRLSPTELSKKYRESFAEKNPELLKKAEEAFVKEYRRAPMVLSWYMEGQLAFRGILPKDVTDEDIDAIVKSFNQKNVAKVAKYRNATLFGLDGTLNFNNTRDQLIEYIGVQISPDDARILNKKGFFEWLAKYNDISIATLDKILANEEHISFFTLEDNPETTKAKASNARGYQDCLKYESKYGYKFKDNELAIRGRHTVVKKDKMTMRFLSADDYANFTIGYDTNCCQHWQGAGESCVWKYTTDPFAGAVVIEENGEVVAQAFVWTNEETSTFVFDNIEFSTKRDRNADSTAHAKFMGIIDTFCDALPYRNVHMGMGYNTLGNGIGDQIQKGEDVAEVTTLSNKKVVSWHEKFGFYSDYHAAGAGTPARVLKRNGSLAGVEKIDPAAKVTTAPDEPTKWDVLLSPSFVYMLNNCQLSIEERISTAEEFLGNPSEEAQMRMIKSYPQAVLALDNICERAQLYMMQNPNLCDQIDKIKNPIKEIQIELFNKDPYYIKKATLLPEEFKIEAVKRNGMLLEAIDNPSDELIKTALNQNGYAIRTLPREKWTDEYMTLAANTSPKVITLFPECPDEALLAAINKNPDIFVLAKGGSEAIRLRVIQNKPSMILHIDNPKENEVRIAIEQNGLLIRNFQNLYPELREVAIRQNPWAIGAIKHPTFEEAYLATTLEPNTEKRIKDDDLINELHLARALEERGDINLDLQQNGNANIEI